VPPVSGPAYVRANCTHLTGKGAEIENMILEFWKEGRPLKLQAGDGRRARARTSSYGQELKPEPTRATNWEV
jgi:hypothetical protein